MGHYFVVAGVISQDKAALFYQVKKQSVVVCGDLLTVDRVAMTTGRLVDSYRRC